MIDFGKIKFVQEYEDGQSVVHTIRGDSSLDDVIDAFESFLKGAGFHLKDGQHIGYEYDEENDPEIHPIGDLSDTDEYSYQERKEMYDAMDCMAGSFSSVENIVIGSTDDYGHSEYYYDTERNK